MTHYPIEKILIVDQAGDTLLQCPRCGGDYLHHSGVKVYCRSEDSSPGTTYTRVHSKGIHNAIFRSVEMDNPSLRRDGVVIEFACENCGEGKGIELTIAQHKGQTQIGWRWRSKSRKTSKSTPKSRLKDSVPCP
jgi:uncharacterized C2H2 Zn-finger protein